MSRFDLQGRGGFDGSVHFVGVCCSGASIKFPIALVVFTVSFDDFNEYVLFICLCSVALFELGFRSWILFCCTWILDRRFRGRVQGFLFYCVILFAL